MRTRLSSKGQLVLPTELRARRGWRAGTELDVEEVPEGVLLRLARRPRETTLEELLGCTGYRGRKKTHEQMEAAIRDGARGER